MTEAVVVLAKRSPIGKRGGLLKDVEPEDLAAVIIKQILDESCIPAEKIDDVILGNTVGPGGNVSRKSLLIAGLPIEVPGVTVDRRCGSGLEAVNIAARLIQSGAGEVYLAGGVESISRAPWKIKKPVSLYSNHLPEIYMRASFSPRFIGDPEMGEAAENVAERYKISREEQDLFALNSHIKAVESQNNARFLEEIVPIKINNVVVSKDECPRSDTSLEKLANLPPVFRDNGVVTAGNSCPLNDGAAVVLLMSKKKSLEFGIKPILRFVDSVSVGVDPNYLGIGPVPAVEKLFLRNNIEIEDIDIIEFNEAFASQVLASIKSLNIPLSKLNIGGGALALGHPYGASGAILVTRLFTEMKNNNLRRGIVTLGISGGQGIVSLFERYD